MIFYSGVFVGCPEMELLVVQGDRIAACGTESTVPEGLLDGMMNIGRAPTIKSLPEDARETEIHFFGLKEDLYGAYLRVYCHSYLRNERQFDSAGDLIRQLEADRVEAMKRLAAG